ncbi:MAG: alcohol dehydrogenase catalytic domain-containing protein [Deltaproteobacteria bacterium]|nr:alcohol dehydrogenase catalytic domain-containing protein [Deltaproteobacteria bacterium]
MRALEYRLSIPRYLMSRACARIWPHRFVRLVSSLRLRDVAEPTLPGPEWVRIRVERCGICGSDLNALRGEESYSMEPYASFPAVMGHEIIGRVVECGSSVRDVAEQTRVAVENVLPCAARGITPPCPACAAGDYAVCENFTQGNLPPGVITGFTRGLGGGWGETVVAHRSQLFPVPESIPLDQAVLIDSIASALQPVADHFPAAHETVLVIGAGIIGLHVVQCLRFAGFTGSLLVVARHDFQAAWAERLGATHVLRRDLIPAIANLTGARLYRPTLGLPVLDGGVDRVFDCVGASGTIDMALRVLRKRGSLIVVGTASQLNRVDASPLWFKEIRMTGSAMFAHSTVRGLRQRTYQHVIDGLAQGTLRGNGLVTHQFPLRAYAHALTVALDKRRFQSLKVAFTPD